jgi:hypothetical protein
MAEGVTLYARPRVAAVFLAFAVACALFTGGLASAATGPNGGPGPPRAAIVDPDRPRPNGTEHRSLQQNGGFFKDGGVLTYGSAGFFGSPTGMRLAAPVVAMAASPDGEGYWLVGADGGVLAYGDAGYFGGTSARRLYAPIVAMAPTPDGGGYWLVSMDGGIFTFGDARYYGSTGEKRLPVPIVGFAPTPDGKGYWLAGSHGEVYAFGDAGYYGSLGTTDLHNIPIVAIASSYDGRGYWIVQGGGEVIAYGDAPRLGQMPRGHPPVSGIAVTPDGRGYWLLCGNGEVDAFGDAPDLGGNNTAVPRPPISAVVADPAGAGYWLLDAEAFPVSLTHPDAASHQIVDIAASQLQPVRAVRGVVRPVRHLGMGESRHPHPPICLCGLRLRLGPEAYVRDAGHCYARTGRAGVVRDRSTNGGHLAPHRGGGPGLAEWGHRYR